MRLLRASDYRRVPWKNGGGETAEIAVFPAGASMETFDWRVSMADVASDGPFSAFPGIDRTLTLLAGAGMTLDIEGQGRCVLDPASPPLAFPGDAPAVAALADGPVRDLNVMTRRGRFAHRVVPVSVEGHREVLVGSDTALLFCRRGRATVADLGVERFDTVETGRGLLDLSGRAEFCLVLLQKI